MPALEGTVSREWQIDKLMGAIVEISRSSDISYEVKRLMQYREALLSMAPFRVGDRVMLIDPPKIERSSGWYGSKHFLVQGARGEVREVDWTVPLDAESGSEGWFSVYVLFDDESHLSDFDIDNKKLPHDAPRRVVPTPLEHRHVFGMPARRFMDEP